MRIIIFSMLIFLILVNVHGQGTSFGDLFGLNEKDYNTLYEDSEISRVIRKDELPVLMPNIKSKIRILEEIKEIDPTIGVEIIFHYTKTNNLSDDTHKNFVTVYNILQSISTLKGIEYYSASRKRMRVFYKDAYVIESVDNKQRKDDPVYETIPEQSELFSYFKDSSFGNYVGHIEYFYDKNTFLMEIENSTQIWYTFIPMVDPGNLKSYIIVIPIGNEIFFYGYSCLRTINIFNMAETRIDSFYNRIKALYNWFQPRYK
ncbi:MAG: hypothetical protein JXJ04_18170 [Spirochaetales bacterium]|nr:hypothetical protein [Spirochaetales bacterium]